ncbi:MAG: hypothetical protein PVG71_10280 [Anaerolineae bacterium]|jgi:hypothetical protein
MVSERRRYLAYMLRLWQVGEDAKVWRASLENAHTGAHHGFGTIHDLLAFLEEKTGRPPSAATRRSLPRSGESQAGDSDPLAGE